MSEPARTAMAVVDLNRDGIKDVAIGGGNTELSVLLGVGNGTFVRQPVVTLVAGGDPFSASNDVGVGDLNRDSIQDLVVPLGNGHGNAILIGNGNGTFQVRSRIQIDETFAPLHVAVADYNRDSLLDIARTMGDGTNGLMQILRGNGDGTFQAPNRYLVPPPSRGGIMILAGDWNADAKPDIAFVEGGAGAPTIDVLTNTTGGVPPPSQRHLWASASLSLNPTTVTGGNSSTGTVTLTPLRRHRQRLQSLATTPRPSCPPASPFQPARSREISASPPLMYRQLASAVITASLNGTSRSAALTISPVSRRAPTRFDHAIRIRERQLADSGLRRRAPMSNSDHACVCHFQWPTDPVSLRTMGQKIPRSSSLWPVNPQSITCAATSAVKPRAQ